jgi:hypothetical protein
MDVSYPRRRVMSPFLPYSEAAAARRIIWGRAAGVRALLGAAVGVHAACTWRVDRSMDDTDRDRCVAPAPWMQAHVASGCQFVKVGADRRGRPCSWAEMIHYPYVVRWPRSIDRPAKGFIHATIAFVCMRCSIKPISRLNSRVNCYSLDNLKFFVAK